MVNFRKITLFLSRNKSNKILTSKRQLQKQIVQLLFYSLLRCYHAHMLLLLA